MSKISFTIDKSFFVYLGIIGLVFGIVMITIGFYYMNWALQCSQSFFCSLADLFTGEISNVYNRGIELILLGTLVLIMALASIYYGLKK